MNERRAADRYKLPLVGVVSGAPSLNESDLVYANVRDVSTRGVYFTTDRHIPIGASFAFSFNLPTEVTEGSDVSIETRARVVRIAGEPGNALKPIGVAAVFEKYRINPTAIEFALHKAEQKSKTR